jgi:hypothetical protein
VTTEHNAGPLHYPEALQLADLLTAIAEDPMWSAHGEISKSAALRIADELRRLHAVNAELLQALKRLMGETTTMEDALDAARQARAAIAKAEEVKP